jgi:thiol-disulfide isomerase/thioredoxin
MKRLPLALLLTTATVALAQASETEPTLKAGSAVNLEPVTAAKWIQGEPLKTFEPGKVYLFECWATWCGPCIAVIPHVNELHKKYSAKGLRVIGMNVWEDGEEKVVKFVKDKGDGMAYPVAYTGRGSAFETEWLKAAGVRGIPHAFVVKEGRLLFTTHPAQLTGELVEQLLSGDEGARQVADTILAKTAAREKVSAVMREFQAAAAKGDTETMIARIADMEKLDPAGAALPQMKVGLLMAQKDWTGAEKLLNEITGPARDLIISQLARRVGMDAEANCPESLLKQLAVGLAQQVDKARQANPLDHITLASLQWRAGDHSGSLATARKCMELVKALPEGRFPLAPVEKFLRSLEGGALPSNQEFSGWLREAVPARAAAPARAS